jgi:transcriptional regulator with XRE-family HTH domain
MATISEGDFEWDSDKAASNPDRLRAKRGVHLPLRTLREAAGKTQAEVADASGIHQSDISRLEGRESFDDCQVSTLRRYIEALGGRLDLVAAFGNKQIVLVEAKSQDSQDARTV